MTLFVTTFIVLALAMAGLSLPVLLGRTQEVVRGCGRECECARSAPREECQR